MIFVSIAVMCGITTWSFMFLYPGAIGGVSQHAKQRHRHTQPAKPPRARSHRSDRNHTAEVLKKQKAERERAKALLKKQQKEKEKAEKRERERQERRERRERRAREKERQRMHREATFGIDKGGRFNTGFGRKLDDEHARHLEDLASKSLDARSRARATVQREEPVGPNSLCIVPYHEHHPTHALNSTRFRPAIPSTGMIDVVECYVVRIMLCDFIIVSLYCHRVTISSIDQSIVYTSCNHLSSIDQSIM